MARNYSDGCVSLIMCTFAILIIGGFLTLWGVVVYFGFNGDEFANECRVGALDAQAFARIMGMLAFASVVVFLCSGVVEPCIIVQLVIVVVFLIFEIMFLVYLYCVIDNLLIYLLLFMSKTYSIFITGITWHKNQN